MPVAEEALLQPVILAGGSGTRLWPLSRALRPKQFLALAGTKTLLQQTLLRLHGLPCAPALVVCGEEQRFMAAEQLRSIGMTDARILLEPAPRNTAPVAHRPPSPCWACPSATKPAPACSPGAPAARWASTW